MSGGTIVIADDDAELLEVLSIRCRELGLKVGTTNNAFDALSLIDDLMPDVVCLDVEIPCGSGLTVCTALAANPQFASLPIIILTGRSDAKAIRRCHDLGAYYVLKGPDTWSRLEPLLRELLAIDSVEAADGAS